MQHLTYVMSMSLPHNHGKDGASQHTQFHVCTSLVPKPMTVIIGLGMRLDMRMRTRLENAILHNGQQLGSAENSFVDHSKFEGTKLLSGWEAVHSDKDRFHAKIKALFLSYTFAFSCLPRGLWPLI